MARSKLTARKTAGGRAPRKQFRMALAAAPMADNELNEPEMDGGRKPCCYAQAELLRVRKELKQSRRHLNNYYFADQRNTAKVNEANRNVCALKTVNFKLKMRNNKLAARLRDRNTTLVASELKNNRLIRKVEDLEKDNESLGALNRWHESEVASLMAKLKDINKKLEKALTMNIAPMCPLCNDTDKVVATYYNGKCGHAICCDGCWEKDDTQDRLIKLGKCHYSNEELPTEAGHLRLSKAFIGRYHFLRELPQLDDCMEDEDSLSSDDVPDLGDDESSLSSKDEGAV